MWTCELCGQKFVQQNQNHSCNDNSLEDFLRGKSPETLALFHYFIKEFKSFADFELHPAKWRIAFAARTRFGYIHRLGKNYIDVVLHFREVHDDNLCFHKIAGIPGGDVYNHYFRLYSEDDLNEEVRKYLLMAYTNDVNKSH